MVHYVFLCLLILEFPSTLVLCEIGKNGLYSYLKLQGTLW